MYLGYNENTKRYGVLQDDLWIKNAIYKYDEFEALIDGEWVKTKLQYDESIIHSYGFYLLGHSNVILEFLTIRYIDQDNIINEQERSSNKMAKKSFKDNPALQFISTEEPTQPAAEPAPQYPMKRNPLYIETKSRRVQLMFQPSLYNKIKALATEQGKSFNDTVHSILDEHINGKEQP